MGKEYSDVHFDMLFDENGVDIYTKVSLAYTNATALAKNGVAVKSEGQLVIAGTEGYILAPSPWWLTRRFEVQGFRYEISDFISKINGIDKNGYKLTAEEAIAMAGITEEFMKEKDRLLYGAGRN